MKEKLEGIISQLSTQFPSSTYVGKDYTIADLKKELEELLEEIINSEYYLQEVDTNSL